MQCFVLITLLLIVAFDGAYSLSKRVKGNSSSRQRSVHSRRSDFHTYKPIHPLQTVTRNVKIHRLEQRAKRGTTMSNDPLCYRSPIHQNVTLRGGIEAGYFRKLAEHVAMKLCVELCCEEKGCDVAFMWGKHCYGVQCFNHELCEVVPAKQKINEPIMLSHVTFQGETLHREKLSKKRKEECIATEVQPGVALRGGLKAGNFTHIGTVPNMRSCTNLCCAKSRCDLAIVLNDQCFALACFTPVLCEMTRAFSQTYKPKMSYILKSGDYEEQPRNATTKHYQQSQSHVSETKTKTQAPPSLNSQSPNIQNESESENDVEDEQKVKGKGNALTCKNSPIYINSTLKGGFKAGNYTNLGRVENMSECVRLCCGNSQCNAALMLENNCFFVECKNADGCLPVKAKTTHALAALNPRVSFITSRNEEAPLPNQKTKEGVCRPGVISYDVSLKGGSQAGNFTPHGRVSNMEDCIRKCCTRKGCDLAMMLKDICYTVVCKSEKLCEKKHMSLSNGFRPKIAYVFKDKKNIAILGDNKSKTKTISNQSRNKNQNTRVKTPNNSLSLSNNKYRDQEVHQTNQSNVTIQRDPWKESLSSKSKFSPNVVFDQETDNSTTVQYLLKLLKSNIGSPHMQTSTQQEINDDVIDDVTTSQDDAAINTEFENDSDNTRPANQESKNKVQCQNSDCKRQEFQKTCLSNLCNRPLNRAGNTGLVLNKNLEDKDQNTERPSQARNMINSKKLAVTTQKIPNNNVSMQRHSEVVTNTLTRNTKKSDSTSYLNSLKEPVVKSLLTLVHAADKNIEGDDPSCTYSEPLQNATLRGNLHSGKFTDRGDMDSIQQCIRLCCMLKGCDLAFMLDKKCFTVQCKNQKLCEPVQSKSNKFSPTLCYILVKSAHR